MIKNIIFDFGDVFINLDKTATAKEMFIHGYRKPMPGLGELFQSYEKGLISTAVFITSAHRLFPTASQSQLVTAWNAIILDFPEHRLEFIECMAREKEQRLFLLSNTNILHIEKVQQNMGMEKYQRFKNCFEQYYLSYEICMRKPDIEIFEFVLRENNLEAGETLFIDDTSENILAAEQMGIKTWHLEVNKEDITNLKSKL